MKSLRHLAIGVTVATIMGIMPVGAEDLTMHTPSGFQLLSMSPNAKWACGVYVDNGNNTYGFRWNLQGGSIEMLGSEPSMAYGVANDGTVSGEFNDTHVFPNGAPTVMPGYWRDGGWHHLEMPTGGVLSDGIGMGISSDGQYMVGSIAIDGIYRPYIWKNGKIHRELPVEQGKHAVAFAVSPDGNSATGWLEKYNRTACYWPAEGEAVCFEDSPEHSMGPWNYGRKFSPDGNKIVYWGGWEYFEESGEEYLYTIYDVTTGERKKIPIDQIEMDTEFFDISNNEMAVGYCLDRGYIWDGHDGMYIDDYLAARGVDLSSYEDFHYMEGMLPVNRVISISEDENVFAFRYYNTEGGLSSMILKIDQDGSLLTPAEVKGQQLIGLNTVALTWKRPAGYTAVRGYNVYRNGTKISGFLPINRLYYYDRNLEAGTYSYEVGLVGTDGHETRCEAFIVEVTEPTPEAPLNLMARKKGLTGLHASWEAPLSNLIHKRYYNPDGEKYDGIYVYDPIDVELAVRFDRNEMANYDGCTIEEVSFVPLSMHDGWSLNFYTLDDENTPELIYSQEITDELRYKARNVVKLDTPLPLPDADMLVAIQVTVSEDGGKLIGATSNGAIHGYTDLMRRLVDETFDSTFDMSLATASAIQETNWAIDLGLRKEGYNEGKDTVSAYKVYVDGNEVAETDEEIFEIKNVTEGTHTVGVAAVYGDGSSSKAIETEVEMVIAYPAIDEVAINVGENGSTVVEASWEEPEDYDATTISYTTAETATRGLMGPASDDYEYMAAVHFPAERLRGYENYVVKDLRFYPLSEALYTVMLIEDDEIVAVANTAFCDVDTWNILPISDDVVIKPGSDYYVIVNVEEPLFETRSLAIDDMYEFDYYSNLYSVTGGMTWESLLQSANIEGNWMIGMGIEDIEMEPLEVDGYDVLIDNEVCNETPIKEPRYSYDMGAHDTQRHTLKVNVYYPLKAEAVEGTATYFTLSPSGIDSNTIASIKLIGADNYLVAEGDGVESISIYDLKGVKVNTAKGNKISIDNLGSGIYAVKVDASGASFTRKIRINK